MEDMKKKETVEKEEEISEDDVLGKDETEEEELDEIKQIDFETEAKAIMNKLSGDDFIDWAQTKLKEDLEKEDLAILAQLLVENIEKLIEESSFESIITNLDTIDNTLILNYGITQFVDVDSAYGQAQAIVKEQKVPSQNLEYLVSEVCSQIKNKEKLEILLIDENLAKQKQGLLATLFYTLYHQDSEAFIRQIDKSPKMMSLLVGEGHAAKWLTTTYILINTNNETVGSKILEVMYDDAERLAKIPHPEGFSVYFKTLMNSYDENKLSKLLRTIIDQLHKCHRGYEALEYLKPIELIENENRFRLIRKSFEEIANASPKDIDDFAKMLISIEAWYNELSSEIEGDEKTRYIVLDLGLHLVKSLKALMEKMTKQSKNKDEELELLYVKARFLLNGIVRVFRTNADKKMAERLRDAFKSLPKDKKKNRDLWIKTGNILVDEKKKSG
jgi:hypothetical protein